MSYIGNNPGVASQRIVTSFTATAGQTLFTLSSGYTLGYLDVYVNGVKQIDGSDYTASNGTTVTLSQAAAAGDAVECVAYIPRGLSDGYLKSEADARYIHNDVTAGIVWSGDNVGIGTSSPSEKLHIYGANPYILLQGSEASAQTLYMRESAGGLYFGRYGVGTRMLLDSSGNLGLGVTPSAWGSAYKMFQASSQASFGGNSSNITIVGSNYYNDGVSKYIGTGLAALYLQDAGVHKWLTAPSGTAGNAISFTQAMTLDASGRLMIGTTTNQTAATMLTIVGSSSSGSTLYVQGATNTGSGQIGGTITVRDTTAANGVAGLSGISFTSGPGTDFRVGKYYPGSGSPRFVIGDTAAALGTDFVSVDSSGNLLVGTTSTNMTSGGFTIQPSSGQSYSIAGHVSGTGSGAYFYACTYNGSVIGGITQNGTTGVSLTTSSDYRLKENIQPMTGALAKVAALKPVTYKWKADGSDGEGFIAHELAEVAPQCVTGEKDAVDADGSPVYQGIDTSFLVATLTAAIQEQQELINQLTQRITKLEGGTL